jgi:hypothetical protein
MRNLLMAAAAACLAATPSTLVAQAGPRFGAQLSLADDTDVGLGVRFERRLTLPRAQDLRFIGSFDFYFPDDPLRYWEINTNVAWGFRIAGSRLAPYAGGGLNVARASLDGVPRSGDTDIGLNLLGGFRFPGPARVTPFLELRVELSGGDQVVLAGGLMF